MNYLSWLEEEAKVNSNVLNHDGTVGVTAIRDTCGLSDPLDCCACGGANTSADDQVILAAWALTCNTYNTVNDGGASAAECWNSDYKTGCSDYENLVEGGTCASSGADSSGSSGSGGSGGESSGGGSNGGGSNGGDTSGGGSSSNGGSSGRSSSGNSSGAIATASSSFSLMNAAAMIMFVITAVNFL